MTISTDRPTAPAPSKPTPPAPQPSAGRGLVTALSLKDMQVLLQDMGLRAEVTTDANGTPLISSNAHGMLFTVRPGGIAGNSPKDGPAIYIDFAFVLPIQTDRPLPASALNAWNAEKRFARLYEDGGILCLAFDIFVGPGVALQFVRTTIDLWSRLMSELPPYLRSASA